MTRLQRATFGTLLALAFCAVVPPLRGQQFSPMRISVAASAGMSSSFAGETFPVPGLGFDYAHLAAVSGGFAPAQPVHLLRHATPMIPIVLPLYAPPMQIIIVQQPPVVVVQPPAFQAEVMEPVRRTREPEPKEEVMPVRPAEPPREVGELVLVRRDGSILLAVAFLSEGDHLTYITREGNRRSLRLADLDIEATQRMNEERGTTLRLPA